MAMFRMPAPTREELRRGVAFNVIAVITFAIVNATVKWQVTSYPATEVLFFRSAFSMLPAAFMVGTLGGMAALRTRRVGLHLGRGALHFAALICMFTAFRLMPLADAVAIMFTSPLFYTLLSIPLLGERIGAHRLLAVIVGFAGMVLMVRPGPGMFEIGASFAILTAIGGAMISINLRRMSVTETNVALVFYQLLATAVLSAFVLPFVWVTPTLADALVMAGIGLAAGIGQYWLTLAFRNIPAAVMAPIQYTAMLWAAILGYLVWSDIPSPAVIAGAVLIAGAGLYIVYRETLHRRRAKGDDRGA